MLGFILILNLPNLEDIDASTRGTMMLVVDATFLIEGKLYFIHLFSLLLFLVASIGALKGMTGGQGIL